MNLPQFQLVVAAPPGAPFAGLAARCLNEQILSVDYLPSQCFAAAEKAAADPQNQKVVSDLKGRFAAYFEDPRSVRFDGLDLCYSDLPRRIAENRVKLPQDECCKALKMICHEAMSPKGICAYGKFCTYGKIGERVWSSEQSIRKHYSKGTSDPRAKAIGEACRVNPFAVVVPCYRIVNKDKHNSSGLRLGEFMGNRYVRWETGQAQEIGRQIKRWLLVHEGNSVVKPDDGADKMSDWEVRPKSS